MDGRLIHERVDDRELLAMFLRGRDVACGVCRYNLRNATAEKCPECGATIALNVATPTRLGWWLAAFFVGAAAWGFATIMLAAMSASVARGFWSYVALRQSFLLFGGLMLVTSFSSLLMLRLRRRWPMYGPWTRRLTAIGSIVFHVAVVWTVFAFLA